MNTYLVFDFDGTIYNGDSSKDFFLFALFRHPAILRMVPSFLRSAIWYRTKRCSKEDMKSKFFGFLPYLPDVEQEVLCFWKKHICKMRTWYVERNHSADVIISASPEFLLKPVMETFQVVAVIGTQVDPCTGHLIGANCKGEEKVRRFRELFPEAEIETFYSDSRSDRPLAGMAGHAYYVKGKRILAWGK